MHEVLFYALCFALACSGWSCGKANCRASQYVGGECNLPLTVTILKLQLQSLDCQIDKACIVGKCLANLSQLCKTALQWSVCRMLHRVALTQIILLCQNCLLNCILCCNIVATAA